MSRATSRKSRVPPAAIAAAEALLEQRCRERRQRLSPMRRAVFRQMLAKAEPQTAYQVLDGVRATLRKKVAPLSVYRALDFLAAEGWLHRLETTRAFKVCEHPQHRHAGVLFLCRDCGKAEEGEDQALEALIERDAERRGFLAQRQVVEVLGVCRHCAK
jgi:Fur family transcriptional regulator, zinc uptake regulator